MVQRGFVISVLLIFTFVAYNADACDEKEYRKRIVGTWYPVAGENKDRPIEFSKDGEVTLFLEPKVFGTYTVKGNTLTVDIAWKPNEHYKARLTIKKLTDYEMVLESGDWKQSFTFKRK